MQKTVERKTHLRSSRDELNQLKYIYRKFMQKLEQSKTTLSSIYIATSVSQNVDIIYRYYVSSKYAK